MLALRDRIIDRWMESTKAAYQAKAKRVYYLSLEFLIGRLLRDAMSNLELTGAFTSALAASTSTSTSSKPSSPDASARQWRSRPACGVLHGEHGEPRHPAYGYGIRYNHGLFRQKIKDGWQIELPENWLEHGNPWEFGRREAAYEIGFGGQVVTGLDIGNQQQRRWKPAEKLVASACDTPIVGWRGKRVNTLRLWTARAVDPIRLDAFNSGDYGAALAESNKAEIITRVLYPADFDTCRAGIAPAAGVFLHLRLAAGHHPPPHAAIWRGAFAGGEGGDPAQRHASAIAVAELMRISSTITASTGTKPGTSPAAASATPTTRCCPRQLESWPVHLFEHVLPRHMQIIYRSTPASSPMRRSGRLHSEFLASVSLIDEHNGRRVRMGQLAYVGSHSINGVSALHTSLMKQSVFRDLNTLYPAASTTRTNGITPRRWLLGANPKLAALLNDSIGQSVLDDANAPRRGGAVCGDATFRQPSLPSSGTTRKSSRTSSRRAWDQGRSFRHVRRAGEAHHEYKRQLMNILETIALYNAMRAHPATDWVPRVKIFAGKAAPSYSQAKLIIKLINDVAQVVNHDPAIRGLLKVVFIPNYNVSLAEVIVPAADLSEQISTAGMEASGTGNMKFALNGALTIGTLDGANVEILEHVGRDKHRDLRPHAEEGWRSAAARAMTRAPPSRPHPT